MNLRTFLAIVNKVTAYHRHGAAIPKSALDRLANAQLEMEAELEKPTPKVAAGSYHGRVCSVCGEDMNMQGGCWCNGYTVAKAEVPQPPAPAAEAEGGDTVLCKAWTGEPLVPCRQGFKGICGGQCKIARATHPIEK